MRILGKIGIGYKEDMYRAIQEIDGTATWNRNKQYACNKHPQFGSLIDAVILYRLIPLLFIVNEFFSSTANSIVYTDPLRASAERYYRPQELAINEVDPKGKNIAILIHSLKRNETERFQAWTKEYFDFVIKTKYKGGHVSIYIENRQKELTNLVDMGFGYSQLLPIILQLWLVLDSDKTSARHEGVPTVFAIEQPELHLHPKMQAKLADVFLAATDFAKEKNKDIKLIIETHSEAIINRVGHRIARRDFSNNDVNVVLFQKKEDFTEVTTTTYDNDGFLMEWPFGFLEPDRIS